LVEAGREYPSGIDGAGDIGKGKQFLGSAPPAGICSGPLILTATRQELFDFPPAPKLNIYGRLDPAKATPEELRGQEIFFGKAQCAACHIPPITRTT
jgi:hypothetical protein